MSRWISRALLAHRTPPASPPNLVRQGGPSFAFAFGAKIRVKAGLGIGRVFLTYHYCMPLEHGSTTYKTCYYRECKAMGLICLSLSIYPSLRWDLRTIMQFLQLSYGSFWSDHICVIFSMTNVGPPRTPVEFVEVKRPLVSSTPVNRCSIPL